MAGAPGTPAVDHGTISGLVRDSDGGVVDGATIVTAPATNSVMSDVGGQFALAGVPLGVYAVTAQKTGFAPAQANGVSVVAGGTVQLTLILTAVSPTTGSVSGTIYGPPSGSPARIAGAQVCVESTPICSVSGADGTYVLSGISPGPVFVDVTAPGLAAGGTRQAAFIVAGVTSTGIDVELSGRPPDGATYAGSTVCINCHRLEPGLVDAWQSSAHYLACDRTTAHVDVAGWPNEPADCSAPAWASSGVNAADPVSGQTVTVFLVRNRAGCGTAAQFAMAFDSNSSSSLDSSDTLVPVTGTIGGVASGAGQCASPSGLVPGGTACRASYLDAGETTARGYWQQEYVIDISSGPSKPAWVNWDTSNTPGDLLFLPAAWNQRGRQWVNAPDFGTDQGSTHSKKCSGCHETGLTLAVDSNGNTATYSFLEPDIGCEKCHGPGRAHATTADPRLIIDPRYIVAQAANEVCGQCHSNDGTSSGANGAFRFAWGPNPDAGTFVPGVDSLSDFVTWPSSGDPNDYWPAPASDFAITDHTTYVDFGVSKHTNNPYQKLVCADCHHGHSLVGGPAAIARADEKNGDKYVFQSNQLTLQNDVGCLGCHAGHDPFSGLGLSDVASYHLAEGGMIQKNGVVVTADPNAETAAVSAVSDSVNAHMFAAAGMYAFFDPTGAATGVPAGRCSSCHMPKTAATAQYYSGTDSNGRTANAIGDVSSHTFKVATPQLGLSTWAAAATWDAVMPDSCGSCHSSYRFGVMGN
jgi:hypothetical protein